MAGGAFRADLYHRLAVVILDIPPLRQRGDDIGTLAEHFLASHAAAHGIDPKRLDGDARRWLLAYDWPGNVRELSHLMERVTLLVPGVDIGRETVERLRVPVAPAAPRVAESTVTDDEPTRIRDALARSGGNVVRAARLLGLGRNALRHRMRRYGIERPDLDVPTSPSPAAPPVTSHGGRGRAAELGAEAGRRAGDRPRAARGGVRAVDRWRAAGRRRSRSGSAASAERS